MDDGSQYVVAAYAVVLFALLVYVVTVALRTVRIQREAELLARMVEREPPAHDGDVPPVADRVPTHSGRLESADR